MKTRDIVVDSGVLISLTSITLEGIFRFFSEKHNVRFLIPPSVVSECVDYPIENRVKRYLFSALKIKELIDEGILIGLTDSSTKKAQEFKKAANNCYFASGKPLELVGSGEAEVLASSVDLDVPYVLVDERTTRLLVESPLLLKKHLEDEFSVNIMVNKENLRAISSTYSQLNLLRSCELVVLAYEKGFFDHFGDLKKDALEAALFSVKYSGCSMSFDEIAEFMKTVK